MQYGFQFQLPTPRSRRARQNLSREAFDFGFVFVSMRFAEEKIIRHVQMMVAKPSELRVRFADLGVHFGDHQTAFNGFRRRKTAAVIKSENRANVAEL